MQSQRWPGPNRFREALRSSRPPVSMWMTLQSANIVEMAGARGVDTALIDLEHTTSSTADVHVLVLAAHAAGMTALVRPPSADHHDIGRILDGGVDGIVFPMISGTEDAEQANASVRYPPQGRRGWAGTHARHVRWCGTQEPPTLSREFTDASDASVTRIFMIETPDGVDSVDGILDIGAPDAVIFGWGDFALHVDFDPARIAEAGSRIHEACRRRGIGVAIGIDQPDPLPYFPGCFFSAGVDATIMSAALAARMRDVDAAMERLWGTGQGGS